VTAELPHFFYVWSSPSSCDRRALGDAEIYHFYSPIVGFFRPLSKHSPSPSPPRRFFFAVCFTGRPRICFPALRGLFSLTLFFGGLQSQFSLRLGVCNPPHPWLNCPGVHWTHQHSTFRFTLDELRPPFFCHLYHSLGLVLAIGSRCFFYRVSIQTNNPWFHLLFGVMLFFPGTQYRACPYSSRPMRWSVVPLLA